MKLNHHKYKKNYFNYLMNRLSGVDDFGTRPQDIIDHIFRRFYQECSAHRIANLGKLTVMSDWLAGLALNIPYGHIEIIDLAKELGSIDDNPSKRTQERVIENYFIFWANIILSFEPRFDIVRCHQYESNRIIDRGLSIAEAQRHCKDLETRDDGWYDGYTYNSKTRKLFSRYGVK